jgi:hypothetical protein
MVYRVLMKIKIFRYLSGDQLKSESKVDCYVNVLNRGGRLLECK